MQTERNLLWYIFQIVALLLAIFIAGLILISVGAI